MLNEILEYTKKYYPNSCEYKEFEIVNDGIEGTFSEDYLVGQYINIKDSILNDGTYKITEVTSSKITVDATDLVAETNYMYLFGLQLPRAYISLISTITDYYNDQSIKGDIASESQGGRSVSYGTSGSSWQGVFANQLSNYRCMFDDRSYLLRNYDINTKNWR